VLATEWQRTAKTIIKLLVNFDPNSPLARAPGSAGWGLNIEFERGFGGKSRWRASYKTRNGNGETETKRNETKRNETNGTGNHTQNIDSAACCAELDCIFKYETPQRLNQLLSERMSDSERAYQTDL